ERVEPPVAERPGDLGVELLALTEPLGARVCLAAELARAVDLAPRGRARILVRRGRVAVRALGRAELLALEGGLRVAEQAVGLLELGRRRLLRAVGQGLLARAVGLLARRQRAAALRCTRAQHVDELRLAVVELLGLLELTRLVELVGAADLTRDL